MKLRSVLFGIYLAFIVAIGMTPLQAQETPVVPIAQLAQPTQAEAISIPAVTEAAAEHPNGVGLSDGVIVLPGDNGSDTVIVAPSTGDDTSSGTSDRASGLPEWAWLNAGVFLIALAAVLWIIQSALHERSISKALDQVDKSKKDAIEAAYDVLPESWQETGRTLIDSGTTLVTEAMALLKFLHEVTDGEPNDQAPDQAPPAE